LQIVTLLNGLFTQFDASVEKRRLQWTIYGYALAQVETIGD
jgi:hypothetical protein